MIIREATVNDLNSVSICHRRAFPNSFATKLGITYLIKMYGWYLANTFTFLFVMEEGGKTMGYVGGLLKDGVRVGSATGMTQFSFGAALKAMLIRPWLFFHPEVLTRHRFVLKNIRRKLFGAPKQLNVESQKKSAGLVVIAVDPAYQGKGYGSALLKKFEEVSVERGFTTLQLSVNETNVQAIKSYERNGWVVVKTSGKNVEMEKYCS